MKVRAWLDAGLAILIGGVCYAQPPRMSAHDTTAATATEPIVDTHPGDIIAQARTDRIIARLKAESVEQSFQNANYPNDFFYPGYIEESFFEQPLTRIQILLSNRRTMKLYVELKKETPEKRHELLQKYFNIFMAMYRDQIMSFKAKKTRAEVIELANVLMVSAWDEKVAATKPAPIPGNGNAIGMIVLLAALLPDPQLLPEIEKAFQNPDKGFKMDWSDFGDDAKTMLKRIHLFSDYFIKQIGLLYYRNGNEFKDPALKAEVERDARIWKPITLPVPHHTSRVSPYDIKMRFGARVDWSQGREDLVLFDLQDEAELNRYQQKFIEQNKADYTDLKKGN